MFRVQPVVGLETAIDALETENGLPIEVGDSTLGSNPRRSPAQALALRLTHWNFPHRLPRSLSSMSGLRHHKGRSTSWLRSKNAAMSRRTGQSKWRQGTNLDTRGAQDRT